MFDRSYYHEHEIFIDSVRKALSVELAPHLKGWEEHGRFPDSVFTTLGKHGFLGILIGEQYGGIGGDYHLAGAWCETFGELRAVGLTVGVNMHSVVVSHALEKDGSPELKDRWLPEAVKGEKIGAYAFTEPGVGSDLANCRTRADKRGNKWVLNGVKTFITNGARADFVLVLARSDFAAGYKGFTTFVVDTSLPGFKVSRTLDKLGWRSSDTAELVLDNLELDESAVLGQVGAGWVQAARNLNWERLMLTLTALGGARVCFAETLRYATDRKAFGRSLKDFDSVQSLLEEMARKIVASEALSHAALDLLNSGAECRKEVSVAKRLVCEDMIWVADRAIQIHGGYGYTTEFSPEQWWRDLRLMTIGGGTSEIMGNIAAKSLDLLD